MSTKSPECWASDPQARGLRVEVSVGHSLLLPHDQFIFGELKCGKTEQNLRMVFATHEVFLRGCALRKIETAMLRGELAFVCAVPSAYRPLIEDGQPVVLEIKVVAINGQGESAQ